MTTTFSRRDIAGEITAKILAQLEAGVKPWRKPWDSARTGLVLPLRSTGVPYRGVNTIMLWCASIDKGFRSPYWLTLKQANALGAQIRKGELGEFVVYRGQAAKTRVDERGAAVEDRFRFLKHDVAFNTDQIAGLPDEFHPVVTTGAQIPMHEHEQWYAKLEITRIRTADMACYIPSKDAIGMPPIAAFETAEDYAATLNHECVHATMAAHRVGRDTGKRFDKHALAAEELVAEIGASILGAHLNLPIARLNDHSAYIGHWMKLLADDKRASLSAATQAQAAEDWLLAKSPPRAHTPEMEIEAPIDVAA
jgi:antirestriction protein ArdC